jgi:hypothetical protein
MPGLGRRHGLEPERLRAQLDPVAAAPQRFGCSGPIAFQPSPLTPPSAPAGTAAERARVVRDVGPLADQAERLVSAAYGIQ